MSAISILILLCSAAFSRASFTDDEKKTLVEVHNRLRQTPYPFAVAMRQIAWSPKLESLASSTAQKCSFKRSAGPEYVSLGENMYMAPGLKPKHMVLAWFSEKKVSEADVRPCGKNCDRWVQLMSEAVTEIGCSVKRNCTNLDQLVDLAYCLYNHAHGAMRTGPPCSACPASMPVCRDGLCVSQATVLDSINNGTSKDNFQCLLICRNCGKLVTDALNASICRCDCTGTNATGDLCEKKSAASPVKCSPCSPGAISHPCLNGGTVDESVKNPLKCWCKCGASFLGDRCEIPSDAFRNSVKLALCPAQDFSFQPFPVAPPVDKFLFNSKIWPQLKSEMAKAVNSFCRIDSNFGKCCPGKSLPSGAATADYVLADDFFYFKTALTYNLDGALQPLVFANVSSSGLCPSGPSPTYVPRTVLLEALKSAQTVISNGLSGCCENVILMDISVPVPLDLRVSGLEVPSTAHRKSSSVHIPSKILQFIVFIMLVMKMLGH